MHPSLTKSLVENVFCVVFLGYLKNKVVVTHTHCDVVLMCHQLATVINMLLCYIVLKSSCQVELICFKMCYQKP